MATTKKTAAEKATKTESAAKQAPATKAEKTVKPAAKATAPKAEAKKPVAKKTATKKPAAKKPAPKKTTKKPAAKAVAKKDVVVLQFAGKEVDIDTVVEAAKADFKANNKAAVRSISVYLKPEENTAYYVVNGKATGKVSL